LADFQDVRPIVNDTSKTAKINFINSSPRIRYAVLIISTAPDDGIIIDYVQNVEFFQCIEFWSLWIWNVINLYSKYNQCPLVVYTVGREMPGV